MGVAQYRGNNSIESAAQRGSTYAVQSNNNAVASVRQRSTAAEGASVMRCNPTDLSISDWAGVLQLLTSQQLSCSAAVGSMVQQFERELQYKCDSNMESRTESSDAVDEG